MTGADLKVLTDRVEIAVRVNGRLVRRAVEPRLLLGDFLRQEVGVTGTHFGCEHGVCGACTVLVDGVAVRSCLLFAVQTDGCDVRTVEGLEGDPLMQALQECFREHHALQCGYCTPGMLISAYDLLRRGKVRDERSVREGLAGNLCRCTGYSGIVRAVLAAAGHLEPPAPETGGGTAGA